MRVAKFLTTAVICCGPLAVVGQGTAAPDTGGFVVRDATVLRKCGGCHKADSAGRIARLSWIRKAPEGWEASIRRMASLNGVKLQPAEARSIVKYFANTQGLAPAEVKPARFETERRLIDYTYPDGPTDRTCRACHSVGRVLLQRRTRAEWELLIATHRGYYPNSDFQGFRRAGPSPRDSAPAPHPMDQAIAHLSRAFPLHTNDWAAWSATMRPAPIEGTWLLSGNEAGRGAFYGKLVVAKVPGTDDEFTTRATYRYARDSRTVTRDGRSIVYTGHQWRGRSTPTGGTADSAWREVVSVEPGWQEMSGRWFRGGYDEFGMDVTMRRGVAGAAVLGVEPRALRAGMKDVDVTVFGSNLPRVTAATGIDFGPGITVTRVVRSTPDDLVLKVSVDEEVTIGARDLFMAGASMRSAVVAYRTVDRVRVTPQWGMARTGGVVFPKQFAQFEAIGVSNGADGKPETADDLELGTVPVTWSVEEYGVTYKDDDVKYVGGVDQNGFFTPSLDGPNPERKGNRNNIGDVWVVATYQPQGAGARSLKGRGHLIVTVPLYMRWEPTRTSP